MSQQSIPPFSAGPQGRAAGDETAPTGISRRKALQQGVTIAAAGALAGVAVPHVHAAEDNTIRLALIGCGGRGGGAAVNAFDSANGPVKLYAMGDLFEKRLTASHKSLSARYADKVDVPTARQFVGFDAFKSAIDCLRPGSGDVAMLTGYAAWRPVQLEYAVKQGVNAFMEKSFAVDPPAARRIIAAGEEAKKKNLKIAAGLMCRHSINRQEVIKRVRNGELGDIQLIRAYRMHGVGPLAKPCPPDEKELMWQIRNFTKFLWVSGGLYAEMNIHQIDEICWIKDLYPATAHGLGGRAANSLDISQNLDSVSIEWTFPDGTKATDCARWLDRCHNDFSTYIHGTKCAAQFSGTGHASECIIYKDQRIAPDNIAWKAPKEPCSIWEAEWNVLLDAIHHDKPHNEAKRAALTNVADMMGRGAVHMGAMTTWDQVMASNFQFCPNLESLTEDSPAPCQADAQGRYPCPVPGVWKEL